MSDSVDVYMHLRKVLKLRRKCRQGLGDEEEKVRDSDEETAEEEPLPSHTDETTGETDSLWVPNADELSQQQQQQFSYTGKCDLFRRGEPIRRGRGGTRLGGSSCGVGEPRSKTGISYTSSHCIIAISVSHTT